MEDPGCGEQRALPSMQQLAFAIAAVRGQSPRETLSPPLTGCLPPTMAPCPPAGPQAGGGQGWEPSSLLLCSGWARWG